MAAAIRRILTEPGLAAQLGGRARALPADTALAGGGGPLCRAGRAACSRAGWSRWRLMAG